MYTAEWAQGEIVLVVRSASVGDVPEQVHYEFSGNLHGDESPERLELLVADVDMLQLVQSEHLHLVPAQCARGCEPKLVAPRLHCQ